MAENRFLIGPYATGLERDIEPWLLPEDAFEFLDNVYVFRGRLQKRFGYRLLGDFSADIPQLGSRLRINLGNTDGAGNISITVPGTIFKIGQIFSVGNEIFTVNALGAPGTLLSTGSGTGTYNTTTGALVINGAALTTATFFYPAEPVMGLLTRELSTVNKEETIAFDTQFAYQRSGGGWSRLGTAIWTSSNSNFFWSTNYRGQNAYQTFFYVTNFVNADNIRYLPQGSTTWTTLRPQLDAGPARFLETCKILLPFKDRLVALNTIEDDSGVDEPYVNRCRYSQNGDPTNPATSWLDDTPGRGGFIDASTKEAIISAGFIKDRLIVYFERSTWELVYTGNEVLPFRWQQINTELGAESTFSRVIFDKAILSVGNVGIHACNGVNVERIDEKIPDEIFKIHNGNEGTDRVYGIRDFYSEMIYWTFPSQTQDRTFPNRILVYNYQNHSWAFFRDTFTCFGYTQPVSDVSWATLPYATWAEWTAPWNTGALQSEFLEIIAGNQEGWTVVLERNKAANAPFYSITDIVGNTFTVVDHNFEVNDYLLIEDAGGVTGINDVIAKVASIVDSDTIILDATAIGTYIGGGILTRVSNIDIRTKRFNPYMPQGFNFYLDHMDFFVEKTSRGQISIDYFTNESSYSIASAGYPDILLGSPTLDTHPNAIISRFELEQSKLWHRFYFGTTQFNIQIRLFMSEDQMKDRDISQSNFILHGMILSTQPQGRLQ